LEHVQIQFVIDDPERADAIIGSLLARHLVACAQRTGPVTSRYWWHSSLEQSEEWLVLLKTRSGLTASVIDAVVADHPYENPEAIALPVTEGAPGYLEWIDATTAHPG
jgi:periplasmic divalent cation tolerance protein